MITARGRVFSITWYRFRATLRGRLGGYLALILLIGLVGGAAVAAFAAARKTESSFPALLKSTNQSDLTGATAVLNPLLGSDTGYDAARLAALAHLTHVKRVANASGLDVLLLGRDDAPLALPDLPPSAGNGLGSDDGLFFDQDRIVVTKGRTANPTRADEVVMQTALAREAGLHVGQRVSLGVYTNDQTQLPDFGTAKVVPYRQMTVTLVGTAVFASQVVQDDTDSSSGLGLLLTPAFTRPLLDCCANYTETGIQVRGSRNVAGVQASVQRLEPNGFPPMVPTSTNVAKAERAIRPDALALAVFGAIAALAALLIGAQAIGRQVRLDGDDRAVLQALGAGPTVTSSDGLIGIVGAVALGSLLAGAIAIGLSPLGPIGPVRRLDPRASVSFDWTVLGFGLLVLFVALTAVAVVLAARAAPHRVAERRRWGSRGSSVARAATRSPLPAPAVAGVYFALEPGAGRDPVPVRSAMLGAALAIMAIVGTLTFGASLHGLISRPALYGWNWDYVLSAGGASGNVPEQRATELLGHDPHVRSWSGAYSVTLTVDGQTVPVLGERPRAAVQPPILSGHELDRADQIVLGAVTLAQLHKHVGDDVTVAGAAGPARLRIVGTATMPTIGGTGGPHLEMGTGGVLDQELIPAASRNPFNDPETGPQVIFVTLRHGADPVATRRDLQAMATALSNNFNFGVAVVPVLRPAEIVNYRSVSTTPAILGSALGAGAAVALALTLVAAVRRRRRDLALLKTLGFTRRQLAAVVAWQSSVAVAIGAMLGLPVGIAVGRALWSAFANEIHAVPTPTIPTASVLLVALGALVLANIVAAIPGRVAARTPAALGLRTE